MGIWEMLIVAVGVSMDAFAIAICKGLSVKKLETKHMISAGLWFGGAQALLALIGVNMIRESHEETEKLDDSFSAKAMFPLAIADSIDALAVGVTFAFLEVSIVPAVLLIGVTTFMFSAAGVQIGHRFGAKYQSRAELAGGVILIVMGISILLEHTVGR